jgi:hypothetical protein
MRRSYIDPFLGASIEPTVEGSPARKCQGVYPIGTDDRQLQVALPWSPDDGLPILEIVRSWPALGKLAHSNFGLRLLKPLGRQGALSARFTYLPLIAMRFTFDCACAAFGNVTVSTPFLKAADILSSSTSSTGMRRSKRP